MITYPTYLPSPKIDFSYDSKSGTISSKFESGRIAQRARYTKQRNTMKVVFQFDFGELGIFEGFVATTLTNGASEFLLPIPNPVTQEIEHHKVIILNGNYKVKAIAGAGAWLVTTTVVQQDKVPFDADMLALIDTFEGVDPDLLDLIQAFSADIDTWNLYTYPLPALFNGGVNDSGFSVGIGSTPLGTLEVGDTVILDIHMMELGDDVIIPKGPYIIKQLIESEYGDWSIKFEPDVNVIWSGIGTDFYWADGGTVTENITQ